MEITVRGLSGFFFSLSFFPYYYFIVTEELINIQVGGRDPVRMGSSCSPLRTIWDKEAPILYLELFGVEFF